VYAVQVAAVSTASAADAAMQALRARGYTARVFRDQDGLLKVRVGQFTRRQDAEALARELRSILGDGPFVVEARR
jgi:N-acetylmuramoyl-L-alanine amidase